MKKLQLTIYLNEADRSGDLALHEVIVRRLLHLHIAGATVIRGVMGYGLHGQVHRTRLFGVSDDRPVVIVSIDTPDQIHLAVQEIKPLVSEGLITVQEIEVL
jgi:PII-like signaling protein